MVCVNHVLLWVKHAIWSIIMSSYVSIMSYHGSSMPFEVQLWNLLCESLPRCNGAVLTRLTSQNTCKNQISSYIYRWQYKTHTDNLIKSHIYKSHHKTHATITSQHIYTSYHKIHTTIISHAYNNHITKHKQQSHHETYTDTIIKSYTHTHDTTRHIP